MNSLEFQKTINYDFKDIKLLEKALTHSSYTREHGFGRTENNERLEFLGDAFLDAIIGEELYKRLPGTEEGILTKTRALVVCESALARVGKELGIGVFLKLGRGEDHSGGRERTSIIADTVEAVIGAVYLDGGYDKVKDLVLSILNTTIEEAVMGKLHKDYKSQIQELVQKTGTADIRYELEKEEGPDHNKTFYVKLIINGEISGRGSGKSKKDAEQNAAKEAVEEELHVF